ncbi:MAG TPA: DNA mismatch repair protein MutS, partial [Anaerolineales bacterium]|nr:DNA mismatch repair protein MutS [Anaerolineales bacterium]
MKRKDRKVTPIRQQYLEIKNNYPNSILFFRLGDFYETFDEDAQITARDLGIVLTNRKVSKQLSVPMAGIPYHSLENHLRKLVSKGHHVAICDQVGQEQVNGIMQRKVVRIFTPGTMTDPGMIPENRNTYLAAAYQTDGGAVLAYIVVSTGHFRATEFPSEDYEEQLINEL